MSLASCAFTVLRPVLQRLDAETAHDLTIAMLRLAPLVPAAAADQRLAVKVFGMDFPNPLGLAAGFDKNAEVPAAMLAQGFGFVEVGTVTPRPQAGNARPRLFRLAADSAVINRMGFNNAGHAAVLARFRAPQDRRGIIGVNLGANRDSVDRIADYVTGITLFSAVADYLTINISSPNTPGLRALQSRAELQALLDRLNAARARQEQRPPMLLKIAPDLANDELADIAMCCGKGAVDGIIVANTTISRPGLVSPHAGEAGGLSGAPLFALSTRALARLWLMTGGGIPLVGAGGISDAATALAKIRAGASLLQLYSALVYRGPVLVGEILQGLAKAGPLTSQVGADAATLAHHGGSGT